MFTIRKIVIKIQRGHQIFWDAIWRFLEDDGWAIASHIALSGLMSLFPFLIFVTAVAGFFFGSKEYADEVTRILFETWPNVIAKPLSHEMQNVMTSFRSDLITIGVALALYFSSNGIEALRVALNRAYGVRELRWWYMLRLESIAYVLVAAIALLFMAILVVFGPLLWLGIVKYIPALQPFGWIVLFLRITATSFVTVVALTIIHLFLPAGRRSLIDVMPGIVVTILMWGAGGLGFGVYLAQFAQNYVTTYQGLASVMMALVFLYYFSAIFILGGEINAVIMQKRKR